MNPAKANAMLVSLAATLLCGCTASPVVTLIAVNEEAPLKGERTVIPGVPFRVQADQTMRIYNWNAEKGEYVEVASSRQFMADYSRLYAIDVRGSTFASPSLHITENPDNTLKLMNVTSTASAAAANAVGTAISGVAKAQTDRASGILNAQTAVATAQKNLRDALNSLAGLPSNTSAEVRASFQATVTTAQQQLNAACASATAAGSGC